MKRVHVGCVIICSNPSPSTALIFSFLHHKASPQSCFTVESTSFIDCIEHHYSISEIIPTRESVALQPLGTDFFSCFWDNNIELCPFWTMLDNAFSCFLHHHFPSYSELQRRCAPPYGVS